MTQVTVNSEHMFLVKMAELPESSDRIDTIVSTGRPSIELDVAEVNHLISMGFTRTKIAEMLGISRKTFYNWMSKQSLVAPKFSNVDDTQLDSTIASIKQTHPNDGEVMVKAHLMQKGFRVPRHRIRASIHRIDPEGVADRRSKAIKRRVYSVPRPNDVWHIDGNHKLIRWRFVVHGGIDGYSRFIPFLHCSTNNRANTVLSCFKMGVEQCGLPKKVRSDHGGENVNVWRYMMEVHGHQNCVIVGSSTHNERIERLWRDVHRSVLVVFGDLFRELEDEGNLDTLNEVDMFVLHTVFLPRINDSLSAFSASWNNHAISTERMQTPLQLFYSALHLLSDNSSSDESDADTNPSLPSHDPVPVPRCSFQPCQQLMPEIDAIDPTVQCNDHGRGLYLELTRIVGLHLQAGCQICNCM